MTTLEKLIAERIDELEAQRAGAIIEYDAKIEELQGLLGKAGAVEANGVAEPSPGKPSAPAVERNGATTPRGTGWKWEGKVRDLLLAGPKRTVELADKLGLEGANLQPMTGHPWFTKPSRFAPWELTEAGKAG